MAAKKTASKERATKKAAAKTKTKKAATTKPAKKAASKTKTKKAASKTPIKSVAKREDYGSPADAYFAKASGEKKQILEKLRALVKKAAPEAKESIKWGMPVYEQNGLLCYVKAFAGHVSFGFLDHVEELDDPDGLLEGSSKKGGHVRLRDVADVKGPLFTRWVKQAAAANARR